MKYKKSNIIYCGDSSAIIGKLQPNSIDLVITSPPYFGCRKYSDNEEEFGKEENPKTYIKNIVKVIHKLRKPLKETGSVYLNVGDIYFGTKGYSRCTGDYVRKASSQYENHNIVKEDGKYLQHKQRLMLPERIAIALQDKGWVLRNNIIWEKPNPMPSFSKDRRIPVYENIFHFVKNKKYFFDYDRAKELGHHRDVIRCSIEPYGNHIATFPEKLIVPFVETTSRAGDVVLDPFFGSGTVGKVAKDLNRKFVGIELNYEYCLLAKERIDKSVDMFNEEKSKTEIVIV